MYLKFPWLSSRKHLIFRTIFDLLILFSLVKIINWGNSKYILIPFILNFSYIFGFYSNKKNLQKVFFLKNIELFKKCLYHFITSYLCFSFLNLFKILDLAFDKLALFLFFYLIISIVIENNSFIFEKLYKSKSNEWIIIGSKSFEDELCKLQKENKKNLKLVSNISITEKNYLKNKNFIIEDFEKLTIEERKILRDAHVNGYKVFSKLNWCELILQRIPAETFSLYDLIQIEIAPKMNTISFRIKRIGDIVFSLILIIITFPILVFISLLIFLEDRGPIFYTQKRSGLLNKTFTIVKLRSMTINSELDGPQWSYQSDSRVTKIGKIIRKYRLDEIPQLISVLKGEMSLIGPRPERPEIDLKLRSVIDKYDLRYLIKPGLSGWSQVNYPYGASIKDAEMKLSFDIFYMRHFSIFLDLLIFFKTLKLVFNAEGSNPLSTDNK